MFFPIPMEFQRSGGKESIPVANTVLILLNAVVFAFGWGCAVGPGTGLLSLVLYGFSHWGIWHLVVNMWGLWVFGNSVNRRVGNGIYVLAYLGSILAVGLFGRLFLPYGLMGSSGALFAVMTMAMILMPSAVLKVAYLVLFPLTVLIGLLKLPKIWLNWFISWGTFSITALWCLLLIPLIELLSFVGSWISCGWNWVPIAHLLGMVCGVVVVLMLPSRISMRSRSAVSEW